MARYCGLVATILATLALAPTSLLAAEYPTKKP